MVLGWLKPKHNPIAVDIGTDSIKMLQLEPQADQMRLIDAAVTEIPESARSTPQARDDFAAEAIRTMLHQGAFKGRQIVTCLPAANMAVQHLRVTKMTDDELRKALPFEAQGKLPFDATRAVLRHLIVGEVYQDQEAKIEVILMAASRDSVERHLNLLAKCKLEVVGIHVEPSALIECFAHLFRRKGDENISTMFVDMGAGSTHVVIAHGTHMVFAKHVSIGGDTFNKKIAETIKGSFTAARELRIKALAQAQSQRLPAGVVAINNDANGNALGATNGHAAALVDPETLTKIVAALEEPMDILVSELELCVRYYESIHPGKQIDRVIFVGGESRHVSLCQKIAQRLGLPATLGDPMARLLKDSRCQSKVEMRVPQPGWAIAVGLGLGIKGEQTS
ncbi:MAG TPA: pilus assembly protein PilM [Tepidisphaeraceae bacterium]|nr:pilus assembly protein PilM [Tepidisphaeraceae bacterium]